MHENIKNFYKFYSIASIILLIIFCIKSLSVLYYTSSDINLGFPYNSFGFDPIPRFSDYLSIYQTPGFDAIYAANNIAAPYGFLQFAVLKILPFNQNKFVMYANFLFLLLIFLILNFKIFEIPSKNKFIDNLLIFLSIFVANYPFFFLIDRGNLDLYAAIIISLLVFRILSKGFTENSIVNAILISLVISLKPSFALYIFPILICFGIRCILISISLIIALYLLPVAFYDADFFYLLKGIKAAKAILGLPNIFCHNFACAIRALGGNPNVYISILLSISLLPYFIYLYLQIRKVSSDSIKLYACLLISTTATLIINDPSPDYRLIFLLPFFFSIGSFFNFEKLEVRSYLLLLLPAIFIFSHLNIYFIGLSINYFTVLRFIGAMIFTHFSIKLILGKNREYISS